jgi:hypothetical protein
MSPPFKLTFNSVSSVTRSLRDREARQHRPEAENFHVHARRVTAERGPLGGGQAGGGQERFGEVLDGGSAQRVGRVAHAPAMEPGAARDVAVVGSSRHGCAFGAGGARAALIVLPGFRKVGCVDVSPGRTIQPAHMTGWQCLATFLCMR